MQSLFKCRVCGSSKLPKPDETFQYFEEFLYCINTEWLDMAQPIPELETNIFLRSDEIPKTGEKRYLKIRHPFCLTSDNCFKTLFMPASSSVNGIGEPPEELEQSALVTCHLDKFLSRNDFCAWVSVTVQEVILFSELYQYYPARIHSDLFAPFTTHNPHAVQLYPFTWKNWDYDCWTAQGDAGEWKLFFTDPSGIQHLLLWSYWGACDELLYIGNIIKN